MDDHLPDPEDRKWHVRRWVVFWALVASAAALTAPVVADMIPYFSASREARGLAREALKSRQMAAMARQSVSLTLEDHVRWTRRFHSGSRCEALDPIPPQEFQFGQTVMRIQFRPEGSEEVRGIRQLCFHSHEGLLADGTPVANGRVLVQVFPLEDTSSGRTDRATQILMDQLGARVSLVHN